MNDDSGPREFYGFFRSEFGYLEADDGLNPDFNIMQAFHESMHRKTYSWIRACGYWNAFLSLDFGWDARDDYFSLTLRSREPAESVPQAYLHREVIQVDLLLQIFDKRWEPPWKSIGTKDGPELARRYARAIQPHARKMFIPDVRPSKGFEGFSWYPAIEQITSP